MAHHTGAILECRNISIHKAINREHWYSRFLAPVVVARLLQEISIKAEEGQIHAICGVTGSGKTTLFKTIAGHFNDGVIGTVSMNNQIINRTFCDEIGVHMNSKIKLPQSMTVLRLLHIVAERKNRSNNLLHKVLEIMKEMEILGYKDTKCRELSESARRRTLLAVAMVAEPRLLLFDDLLAGLEPLSAYQIMLCLQSYARSRKCIVLISLRNPRSDIYQMVDRLTILFYGQVFYTGLTKSFPEHFAGAGFSCPSNENPAIYYLSLDTLDRETEERKAETREKALRLVEYQKEHSMDIYAEPDFTLRHSTRENRKKENQFRLFWYYVKCSLLSIPANPSYALSLFLLVPMVVAGTCLFCSSLSVGYWHTPHNAASTFELNWFANFSISGIFVRNSYNMFIHLLSLTDPSFCIGILSLFGFIIVQLIVISISGIIGAAISYWIVDISEGFLTYCIVLSSAALFGVLFQMLLLLSIPSKKDTVFWHLLVALLTLMTGGFKVSLPTTPIAVQWFSFMNPLKYANIIFSNDIIASLNIENCRRIEKQGVDTSQPTDFCRWKDSSAFLEEIYGETKTMMNAENAWIILFVHLLTLFVVLSVITLVKNKL